MTMLRGDWEKSRIVLVDPAVWPCYSRGRIDLRPVFSELVKVLESWNVDVEILGAHDSPLDIWIRDWGFVAGAFFRYQPDYAEGLYAPMAIARAREGLVRRLGISCRALPLVVDGGNLIHNGRIAILTEKILFDNSNFSRNEIERMILSLGFERVVFVPVELGDEIGHSDGMCRFISDGVLLVNDYDTTEMRAFGRRLRRVLHAARLGIDLVSIPWSCREGRIDGVPSAEGCYMNFLQLAQGNVLPAFGHPKDDIAREVLESLIRTPVASVGATPLARLGGVFNCVSLTY